MRGAKGHPLLHENVGNIGGQGKTGGSVFCHRFEIEAQRCQESREGRQNKRERIHRVKERFFVFLQVPVIGQGQRLQRGHKPRQVSDHPA